MTSVCFRRLVFRNPAHQGLAYLHITLARIGKPDRRYAGIAVRL